MRKGWGYGRNSASIADKLRNKKTLVCIMQDGEKVYKTQYKDNICNYTLDIIYYSKRKLIVIKGLYKAQQYNVGQFKNQIEIYNYIGNTLIQLYHDFNAKFEREYFKEEKSL